MSYKGGKSHVKNSAFCHKINGMRFSFWDGVNAQLTLSSLLTLSRRVRLSQMFAVLFLFQKDWLSIIEPEAALYL